MNHQAGASVGGCFDLSKNHLLLLKSIKLSSISKLRSKMIIKTYHFLSPKSRSTSKSEQDHHQLLRLICLIPLRQNWSVPNSARRDGNDNHSCCCYCCQKCFGPKQTHRKTLAALPVGAKPQPENRSTDYFHPTGSWCGQRVPPLLLSRVHTGTGLCCAAHSLPSFFLSLPLQPQKQQQQT